VATLDKGFFLTRFSRGLPAKLSPYMCSGLFFVLLSFESCKPNLSLYSPYYAEACNELAVPSLQHSAKAT